MISNAITSLENLGLSNYEARTYIGLLQTQPVNGYTLSKATGVPRSRIYDTLDKLVEKGMAIKLESDPIEYIPLSSEEFVIRTNSNVDENLSVFEETMGRLAKKTKSRDILIFEGRQQFLAQALQMIARATQSIYLMGWGEIDSEISNSIGRAAEHGLQVILIGSKRSNITHNNQFTHLFESESESDLAGTYMVVDGREAIMVTSTEAEQRRSVWTNEPGLVASVEEFFRLQMFAQNLVDELGFSRSALIKKMGHQAIRDVPYIEERKSKDQETSRYEQRDSAFDEILIDDFSGVAAWFSSSISIKP